VAISYHGVSSATQLEHERTGEVLAVMHHTGGPPGLDSQGRAAFLVYLQEVADKFRERRGQSPRPATEHGLAGAATPPLDTGMMAWSIDVMLVAGCECENLGGAAQCPSSHRNLWKPAPSL